MTTDSVLPAAASGVPPSTGRWKRYPAYRDSGVEWLGKIPAHWEVKRLKNMAVMNPDSLGETMPPDYQLLYVDITNVDSNGNLLDMEDLCFEDAPTRARRRVKDGDTIISTVRTYLKAIALINQPPDNLIVSTGFAVLRPCGDVHPNYLSRLVQAEPFIQAVVAHSEGVGYPAISPSRLGTLPVWLPPLPEQRTIADFVDRETAKIDALVVKKERLVELLQEKRAALISHAVTKGLDPNAPMRDSGVEWLGEIPAHWDVRRLKFLTPQVTVGIVVTPAKYYVDEGIPCLRSLNVKEGHLSEDDLVFISDESNEELRKSKIFAGDLVAVRTGQPGTTAVVDSRFEGANCIDLIIIRKSSKFNSTFMAYVANSSMAKTQFGAGADGAIQQHFNIETAKSLRICLPPMGEQQDLVSFLDTEAGKIDTLIERVLQHIDKLREFRTALISAAVTGKIDVREKLA